MTFKTQDASPDLLNASHRCTPILADFNETCSNVHLSKRETEVLQYSANGASAKEIASLLHLSEHTVREYLSSACTKLGARNRTEAVARAIRIRLIH